MITHHVKVVMGKQTIYLEKAQYHKGFLVGYQVNKNGEAVIKQGTDILHVIQLGEGGPKVYIQAFNPMYCELENANPVDGRWTPGIPSKKARIH